MILKLKYFGMIAEAIGKDNEELDVSALTVGELQTLLIKQYNKLEDKNFKIAVNQKMVEEKFNLNNNDEVALLPPFAGG